MAYALRHVDPDTAQDVVSETFLVAWRRQVAVPDDPLPWLLVVARNSIANLRRSQRRQGRVATELERLQEVAEPASAADVLAADRATVLAVLAALTAKEREAFTADRVGRLVARTSIDGGRVLGPYLPCAPVPGPTTAEHQPRCRGPAIGCRRDIPVCPFLRRCPMTMDMDRMSILARLKPVTVVETAWPAPLRDARLRAGTACCRGLSADFPALAATTW
jgi:hypothetical protein